MFNIELDDTNDLLFFSGQMLSSRNSSILGVDCSDSPSNCAVIGCLHAATGEVMWVRTVHGAPGAFFTGEVKLAHPSDG